jgi:hypothetical protein
MCRRLLAFCLSLIACGRGEQRASLRAGGPADSVTTTAVPDSLALRTANGSEVWFTAFRSDSDSTGRGCSERVLEIRRDGRRIPVPLLYTGAAPTVVDDSTILARVWRHCRPGDVYHVDLESGRPTPVHQ